MNLLHIENCITDFIRNEVTTSNSQGVVLGLSGGIDSSVALYLATKALGNNKVSGLILPDKKVSRQSDIDDAIELSQKVAINYHVIDITEIKQKYMDILPLEKISIGNLTARIRMNFIYYYANIEHKLVLGTSDKSELMIGYFTKFGDGAADILPLADIYKTEVRELAKYLNLPKKILLKKSSPSLWKDQTAEDEIGMEYEKIDTILKNLAENISDNTNNKYLLKKGIDKNDILFIKHLLSKNKHKITLPKTCMIS
ncbi:MAG TPA: NAD+ synthase [Nitrososphaeraceae archaeon]|nr:NAD+ synthase [Nitrososphaeraceae archaeon]